MDNKQCRKCGELKKLDDFYTNKETKDKRGVWCKECTKDNMRKWYADNKDRFRDTEYRRKFGISLADYDALLKEQGGVCAVCRLPETARDKINLSVDHCHTTGKVRGLLCVPCNRALGMFKDDPNLLREAVKYLTR